MADNSTIISNLPDIEPDSGAVLYAENSSESGVIDYETLAASIVEDYAGSTLGGMKQSVQDALMKLKASATGPMAVSTAAEMTDRNTVYVYTGSESGYVFGGWYYYNGSVWAYGGDYNSASADAEAWATGERNGTAVGSGDITYHNNAKYYAQLADDAATAAEASAVNADASASDADTSALSAAQSARQADAAAQDAETAKDEAETAASSVADASAKIDATANDVLALSGRVDSLSNRTNTLIGDLESDMDALAGRVDDIEESLSDIGIDVDDLGLEQDEETGYVYPTYRGVRSENGIPLAAGGGGGGGGDSGNNAVLTVTNTSGWLSRTLSAGAACTVSVRWSSLEDEIPTGNGSMTIKVDGVTKKVENVTQGEVSAEIGGFLSSGSNKVKLTISDVYDNKKTITFTVSVVELTISSSFDSSTAFPAGQSVAFTYKPTGATEKTVYFILDGITIGTEVISTSGRQQTYHLPAMTHGCHSLRVYFTAVVDGETVRSNELYFEMIVVDDSSDLPIIVSSFDTSSVTQYATLVIPYSVYTPGSLTSAVTLYVNNKPVADLTVDRTTQTWTYRADSAGSLTLTITTGTVMRSFAVTVEASDMDAEAETDALALYLSSSGRSNNEANPGSWVYQDIAAVFSGFNYSSDGWVSDPDGTTVLRVAGDARVTIPYKAFANDFRSTGKTIEIEFATRDVMDYDAVIMSCMSGGRGFSLTAQKASLFSEQSEISMQYKEDEHVRISFVAEKRSENRLLYIYVNGIVSGVVQYPDGDDFSQKTPVDISVGSNDCTVDLYCIRVYDNDLTRHQLLNNWIADTQNVEDMLDRYQRNHVYDEYGSVVIDQLPGELPYMIIECPELPQYKGDKKTVDVTYVDPTAPSRSFTATGAQADVQGTSSQYYARKNYKIKFKNGFDMTQSGSHVANYPLRVGAVPTNAFCYKADVASSEGANNVELARLYNDTCPYKTPPQKVNSAIRQGIDGFPMVIFWSDGTNTTFLGKYNFNNDKGTEEVFGFAEGDESWEIKNNTSDRVLFKSADFTSTYTDEDGKVSPAWLNDFEGRYPEDNTDPTNLKALSEWLVTTDRDAVSSASEKAARLTKFSTELSQHMEKEALIFYYLFTELFLMVDSRAKNAFPSFLGGDKWFSLPYDFDTALGIAC